MNTEDQDNEKLSVDNIEKKLKVRSTTRKALYVAIPTLAIVVYLSVTAYMQNNAESFLFGWFPFN